MSPTRRFAPPASRRAQSSQSRIRCATRAAARRSKRCGRTFGLASACFDGRRPSLAPRSSRSRSGSAPTAHVFGLLNALRLRVFPFPTRRSSPIRLDGPRCCRHTGRNKQLALPFWNEISAEHQAFTELIAFADTRFTPRRGRGSLCRGAVRFGKLLPGARRVRRAPSARFREDDRPGCSAGHPEFSDALWRRESGGASNILSSHDPYTDRTGGNHRCDALGLFGVEVGRRFDLAIAPLRLGVQPGGPLVARRPRSAQPGWTDRSGDLPRPRARSPPRHNAAELWSGAGEAVCRP